MYTLEEIQNFTPERRNFMIDEIIRYCEWCGFGICHYISHKTNFLYAKPFISKAKYLEALNIPCIKHIGLNWFETMEQRITFLKAQKTAE